MGTETVHDFLTERLKGLPQASAIALVNDAGRLVNFSHPWPVPVMDVSEREYFRHLRDHPAPAPFIGPPVRSKVNGAWTIAIARRVSGPGGEFLGIVASFVEARYFEDFYQAINTNKGESIGLFRHDGTVLARYPHIEKMIGEKISTKSPWYENVASGGGTYRTPGYIGEIPRIISVQPISEYPLAVTVGISEEVALAPWRRQSIIIAVGALGAVIGFGILFRVLAGQLRRLEHRTTELAEVAEALRGSEARFRGFALTSSDWFWETDPEHRITYVSEGIRAIGLDPTDRIGPVASSYRRMPEVRRSNGKSILPR
jgi:PAS domain-containing protein